MHIDDGYRRRDGTVKQHINYRPLKLRQAAYTFEKSYRTWTMPAHLSICPSLCPIFWSGVAVGVLMVRLMYKEFDGNTISCIWTNALPIDGPTNQQTDGRATHRVKREKPKPKSIQNWCSDTQRHAPVNEERARGRYWPKTGVRCLGSNPIHQFRLGCYHLDFH